MFTVSVWLQSCDWGEDFNYGHDPVDGTLVSYDLDHFTVAPPTMKLSNLTTDHQHCKYLPTPFNCRQTAQNCLSAYFNYSNHSYTWRHWE